MTGAPLKIPFASQERIQGTGREAFLSPPQHHGEVPPLKPPLNCYVLSEGALTG